MSSENQNSWDNSLIYIRSRVEETAFQTWFEGVEVGLISEESITLIVPNRFHYE